MKKKRRSGVALYFFYTFAPFISIVVDRLKEYKIAYKGLAEGKHTFEYILDEDFFNCFPATEGTKGKLKARVLMAKSSLLMDVKMNIEGSVRAVCDRCLEELDLPIRGEMHVCVKNGQREEGNGDDFIVLSQDEDFFDVSPLLYEMYMLNYPLRVVHAEGECNPEMEKVFDKLLIEESEKIDPRWEELKKLINNN